MTDTKHTPGPWRVSSRHDRYGNIHIEGPTGDADLDVASTRPENARLIAAAPELLAALERLEKAQHPFTPRKGWSQLELADAWQKERHAASEAARAAIARAKGGK